MDYDQGNGDQENWIVAENVFRTRFQGKCESIFSLGNGYLGIRSSTEESYYRQTRGFFVSGTFNKSDPGEVTELPNAADMTGMDIEIDGELLNLEKGSYSGYIRSLNLKNGELLRRFTWTTTDGKKIRFGFRRFVSLSDRHTFGSEVSISPLNCHVEVTVRSGINGQVTNSGAQHFEEGEKRIYDHKYLQMLQNTSESGIVFIHSAVHDFSRCNMEVSSRFEMVRRKVQMIFEGKAGKGDTFQFSKISNIYTTRDSDTAKFSLEELKDFSLGEIRHQSEKGYEKLFQESCQKWGDYWNRMDIRVESENSFDQLAIRFALYHLLIMAPKHDPRMGIAAKGLSGEGYKGHSFWDTEIFILPFFIYTFPDIARKLLEYRHITLPGARKKARENSYKGAMYPWESAWADDGEVTPVWGAADIVTGKATKIWSGFIEQHITADVAFAVWQYYTATGDDDFMIAHGYEILLDSGIFWGSRLEWDNELLRYHINDVLGPDEYKEHVNNDAYTNHMAKWCMDQALVYYDILKESEPETFERLNHSLNLVTEMKELREKAGKIYLPIPNGRGVIPQDDTYLQKKEINLEKYRNQDQVDLIFRDYNLDQVNQMQVTKQASVVMLMYLLESKFDPVIRKANFDYYEPRTTHDSSLSLSMHAILASDTGNTALAYQQYEKAARIDLGPGMKSSDKGIHSASLGGIWQMLVCGFGGFRMVDGMLRIDPKLPDKIHSITYPITWRSNRIKVSVNRDTIRVTNHSPGSVILNIAGTGYTVEKEVTVRYS